MNFDEIVNDRLFKIKDVLGKKSIEYSSNHDRFHNFRIAAKIAGNSPERALFGMMLKHWVSVIDLIDWSDNSDPRLNKKIIDEKIGDAINYLILLEGLLCQK